MQGNISNEGGHKHKVKFSNLQIGLQFEIVIKSRLKMSVCLVQRLGPARDNEKGKICLKNLLLPNAKFKRKYRMFSNSVLDI